MATTKKTNSNKKGIITKIKSSPFPGIKYNAQVYTKTPNGYAYAGNGRFTRTKKEAEEWLKQEGCNNIKTK